MRLAASHAVARILLLAARLSKEPDATPHNTGLTSGWNTTARLMFRENRRDPACRFGIDEKRKDHT
jgi:hypothetical protein